MIAQLLSHSQRNSIDENTAGHGSGYSNYQRCGSRRQSHLLTFRYNDVASFEVVNGELKLKTGVTANYEPTQP